MKKYNSSYEIPDYEEMQKMVKEMRVKLDKKHPFVLKIGLDNAYYDPMGGRIGLAKCGLLMTTSMTAIQKRTHGQG